MYSVLLLNCSMYALVDSYQDLNFKLWLKSIFLSPDLIHMTHGTWQIAYYDIIQAY